MGKKTEVAEAPVPETVDNAAPEMTDRVLVENVQRFAVLLKSVGIMADRIKTVDDMNRRAAESAGRLEAAEKAEAEAGERLAAVNEQVQLAETSRDEALERADNVVEEASERAKDILAKAQTDADQIVANAEAAATAEQEALAAQKFRLLTDIDALEKELASTDETVAARQKALAGIESDIARSKAVITKMLNTQKEE